MFLVHVLPHSLRICQWKIVPRSKKSAEHPTLLRETECMPLEIAAMRAPVGAVQRAATTAQRTARMCIFTIHSVGRLDGTEGNERHPAQKWPLRGLDGVNQCSKNLIVRQLLPILVHDADSAKTGASGIYERLDDAEHAQKHIGMTRQRSALLRTNSTRNPRGRQRANFCRFLPIGARADCGCHE